MAQIKKALYRDKYLIALSILPILYYIIFHYLPMYGLVIAFKDYSISKGILGSDWVGLKWFSEFFKSYYFVRLLKNTLLISVYGLIIGFPIPIVFALMLNEFRNGPFKKIVQTVSYLPHFISLVVVVSIITNFLSPVGGIINQMITLFGGQPVNFLYEPGWFRTVYIGSDIWQGFGWGSIIYLATLANVDPQLYEAATIDGAKKFKQLLYITLPCILPTIIIMLIMRVGQIMSVGFEKIILLYNPSTYETADVISTYVYRRGVLGAQYGFGAAVGMFNSVINMILLVSVNAISKRVSEIALW